MFTSQIIKDNAGQHYIICLRHFTPQTQALKPEKFANSQASFQFVTSLQAPFGLWQSIASASSFFDFKGWQNNHTHLAIEHYIAEALQQGFVTVYKTASLQQRHQQSANTRVKDESGTSYQLQPQTALLLNSHNDIKPVINESDAQQFIERLSLDDDSMRELLSSHHVHSRKNPGEALVEALQKGTFVVTVIPEAKPESLTEFIEETVNAIEPAPAEAITTKSIPLSNERADNGSADALMKAAEDGSPFCEECEKAKEVA